MIDKKVQEINKWVVYPDVLERGRFRGYITRDDISQIKGAFPVGQNIQFTDGLTPTIRPGSIAVGTEDDNETPITRAWRFELRDGTEIDMRAYDDKVDYRIEGVMEEYATLKAGFTPNLEFCFAVIAKSTEIPSACFFCNGVEDWQRWSGAYAQYQSDNAASVITVDKLLSKPSYISGGVIVPAKFSDFESVSDGSFRIKINGAYYNIDGIDFTGVADMDGVAAIIQADVRTASGGTATCTYNPTRSALELFDDDDSTSEVSLAITSTGTVGTDISGAGAKPYLRWSSDEGAAVFARETYEFDTVGKIVINSEVITYTGISGYTFTGCDQVPTTPTVDDVLVQEPINANLPDFKGSVGGVHDGRIHARLETRKSVSNYSKLDDPADWSQGSTDGDGGAKDIEQGGPITAYGRDEELLYIFKKRSIKTLAFKQSGDRVDVPVYKNLKPADDKSTTTGAIGQKSTFSSPNGVLFVTEDKELLHLTREEGIDYPQLINISDSISPTFKAGVHNEASGIVFKSKVYYSFKQDSDSSYNNVVIVYDLIKRIWQTPYIGWNVADWTIINNKLRWHSSINANTYELQDDKLDNEGAMTTILRTHSENFDEPFKQKTIAGVAVEIYLTDNFDGKLCVLYDDDGFTDNRKFTINALDDNSHRLKKVSYNVFGASAFGTDRFGSNIDLSGMKRHIFVIPLKSNTPFFGVSLQISTEKENINYELTRYAYLLNTIIQVDDKNFVKQ